VKLEGERGGGHRATLFVAPIGDSAYVCYRGPRRDNTIVRWAEVPARIGSMYSPKQPVRRDHALILEADEAQRIFEPANEELLLVSE
jgi:hypothetical protein